jgi:hypothetical protein
MLIEPVTGLLIDRRKLSDISTRGTITISVNRQAVIDAGFKPGEDVNIIYGKKKIVIVNDVAEILADMKGMYEDKNCKKKIVNVIGNELATGDAYIKEEGEV